MTCQQAGHKCHPASQMQSKKLNGNLFVPAGVYSLSKQNKLSGPELLLGG
jgi:hypothetical protein